MAEAAPVRPGGRLRVVRVADEDYPRREWDLVAGDAVGVAAAVPALVAVSDDRPHALEPVDRGDDPLAELRMRLHDRPLRRREAPRLREHVARDADLADVVQQGAELEALERAIVEAELLTHAQREILDPAGVSGRVLVVRLESVGESLDRGDERPLEAF